MQHEIARMEQLLEELDEQQLEIMGRLEQAEQAKEAMVTESAAIMDDVAATKVEFGKETADLDNELREVGAAAEALRGELPPALVNEYERAWARNGALAVLEFRDGDIVGGLADLSPSELDQIRKAPADQLYWTEDDQQIVVRVP